MINNRNTIFTLTSGRSGTLSLCGLIRRNFPNCTVMHEPYLHPGNPTMFGLPIYDHLVKNQDAIRKLVKQKQETIKRYRSALYIETSHAFLKSYWDIAPDFFPKIKVIHLIRNPLEVARSEVNREIFINRWKLPFRHYRGRDKRKYFRWALTGREPIFGSFDPESLTLFKRYLIQWIEIENRAMEFIDRFNMKASCMTLHVPKELNDPQLIIKLFHFFNLEPSSAKMVLPRFQNRTPGTPTIIGEEERRGCQEIINKIPESYLKIFQNDPYADCEWRKFFRKNS